MTRGPGRASPDLPDFPLESSMSKPHRFLALPSGAMYGTWTGHCTTEFYVNPDSPSSMQCALPTSLNQFYTYPFRQVTRLACLCQIRVVCATAHPCKNIAAPGFCSVTFGAGNSYAFTSGKFSAIGQNVSFSNGRVNMTNYEYSKR